MITKTCPECELQVPVACKACRCGYSFYNAKKALLQEQLIVPTDDSRRRTSRVRRERPNYYDSLEYDRQLKKSKRLRKRSECAGGGGGDEDAEGSSRPTRAKRKRVKKDEEEEEDVMRKLSPEKQMQCSLILAEINRKLQLVTWKPPDD